MTLVADRDPSICTVFWGGRQKYHFRDLHGEVQLLEIPTEAHAGLVHLCQCGATST